MDRSSPSHSPLPATFHFSISWLVWRYSASYQFDLINWYLAYHLLRRSYKEFQAASVSDEGQCLAHPFVVIPCLRKAHSEGAGHSNTSRFDREKTLIESKITLFGRNVVLRQVHGHCFSGIRTCSIDFSPHTCCATEPHQQQQLNKVTAGRICTQNFLKCLKYSNSTIILLESH